MKATIERLVASPRFSMTELHRAVWPLVESHPTLSTHLFSLQRRLGEDGYRFLSDAMLRHVFLIELVKLPAAETTKYRARWFEELQTSQRYCSFEESVAIAHDLLEEMATGWLDQPDQAKALNLFFAHRLLPYEVPLDYRECPGPTDHTTPIHRRGNLVWRCDATILRTLKLREYLRDRRMSPDAAFFRKVLEDKIKVKTYLTDRSLTGLYKTNREKRWEVNPHSVQFASRHQAIEIEYKLVTQLCAFDGFPESVRQALQDRSILPSGLEVFRCPVTLEPMSYSAFRDELMNPTHGKSAFQIGHLFPLKLDEPARDVYGHVADNISWISADGNRIQGSMSLTDVRSLLKRIAQNYERCGWV